MTGGGASGQVGAAGGGTGAGGGGPPASGSSAGRGDGEGVDRGSVGRSGGGSSRGVPPGGVGWSSGIYSSSRSCAVRGAGVPPGRRRSTPYDGPAGRASVPAPAGWAGAGRALLSSGRWRRGRRPSRRRG